MAGHRGPGLSSEQRDAVSNEMAADEYEGGDLLTMKTKRFGRMLSRTVGAACIPALLSARDEYVAASRAAEARAVTPPDACMCPISHELMKDPVSTSSGQCYERVEIEKWRKKHQTDPMPNARQQNKQLTPIVRLRQMIAEWREKHPEYGIA
eukprot:SAG22_NODE_2950_length_2081_cov_2.078708_2_plen_152_part_00